jgi:NAD(P)H-dependent FMN reductase
VTRIAVIVTSTRHDRFADKPARWVQAQLAQDEGVEVDLIDLRDFDLPFFDGPPPATHPRAYTNAEVERFAIHIDAADAFLVLTPEYNHGYTADLKNAMDWTFIEWNRKPIAFIGWGNVGAARAIEQLRTVAIEFEMAPVRHAVHILPDVFRPARAKTDPADLTAFEPLQERFTRMLDDLVWWSNVLKAGRSNLH